MKKITSNKEKHYLAVTLSGDNDKEVIKQMASALEEEGYVKDTFADAIVKRESVYPTGLPVGQINVAIPHTDPEHVNNAAICLGILDKPVTFNVMGMEGETTEVSLDYEPELLYKNMVAAKAQWLYELEEWNDIITPERQKELYKEEKRSGTIVKEKKIGRNDPCPCGSGKKYKFCCGR